MASNFNDFLKENEFSADYLVKNLMNICYEGAILVKSYYHEDIEIKHKKDKSPVTIADEEVETLIISKLKEYFPKILTIGEETVASTQEKLPFIDTFFCIDPIDGTRQFVNRKGFFTVNIGLIYKQKPIFGIVIDPMTNICWFGGPDYGSFKQDSKESSPYPIAVDNTRSIHNPLLLVSSLNWKEKHISIFTSLGYPPYDIQPFGSSIKMVMIAEGKGDIYPRIAPTCEWDTAAAHAILLGAGGDIYDLKTQAPILYGKNDRRYYNNFFIACKTNNMEDIRPIVNYSDVELENLYTQSTQEKQSENPKANHKTYDTQILAYNNDNLALVCEELQSGEVIAIPTETVYGLSANACDDLAVSKIYQAKGRPSFNPLIVHFYNMDHVKEYVEVNEWACKIMENLGPAPITMILKRKENTKLSQLVSAGLETVGVRIPNHPIALDIIKKSNLPLSAPSANGSGLVSPTTSDHVLKSLGGRIPYIMEGGDSHVGVESTVVDLSSHVPTILRYGVISQQDLERILETPVNTVNTNDDNSPKSPGMMTSHYSPSLPVFKDVLKPKDKQAYIGFGSPNGNGNHDHDIFTDNLSVSGDLVEACANLFKFLHKYDNKDSYESIAFSPIPYEGLGLALNDRLQRASLDI